MKYDVICIFALMCTRFKLAFAKVSHRIVVYVFRTQPRKWRVIRKNDCVRDSLVGVAL